MKEMLIKSNINRCQKETYPHVFHQVLVSLRLWGTNDPSTLYYSSTGHRDKRAKHTTVLLLMDELKGKPLFNHLSCSLAPPNPTHIIKLSSQIFFLFTANVLSPPHSLYYSPSRTHSGSTHSYHPLPIFLTTHFSWSSIVC